MHSGSRDVNDVGLKLLFFSDLFFFWWHLHHCWLGAGWLREYIKTTTTTTRFLTV
jgi:hypothetical protein